ncbi:hypothetical protein AURANDRAFT_23039 [Aureococcus anophagefferens]|uniref:Citrate synthase n=1 Tax=Aureococcus anophagefferens TaxID=44056 RepID=F0Y3Z8_AURAN|nr:hypothetical protein AURANDRAFT_23039 [Aureococcus anophagefferens]EGB10485.1 hypothetical protein AURANDRAFT_23039 [Aureococcus anophagefferens]|eukprot:XP_009035277.1 hypothetical protein AURANDRAFT_23039 [Aureococcus anophagefferens]
MPLVRGSAGAPCIDVTKLHAATGLYTLDPGFTATSSCRSSITYIDGPKGVLLHRGYAIGELAARSSFLEVCYLLLNGRLPASEKRLKKFEVEVVRRMTVHERLKAFMTGFPDGAHPMAVMVGTVGALSAFYHRGDVRAMDDAARALAAVRVVAKLPTIAAMAYRHSVGLPYVGPRAGKSVAANLLHMCFASPLDCGDWVQPSAVFEKALDVFLLLHADHEQNASTSTVRLAASSEANPFACVASGIASLWGPMHGGANEACIRMLREIGDASRIPEFLARAKDKADPFKLMGFGHRVYRNLDPRAKEMRTLALAETDAAPAGASEEVELRTLFKLAEELERQALADDYFVTRKLFPNVDFYSGLALTAMGIPTSLFTCLFAVGRGVGWIAQWKEAMEDPGRKISRPRQVYVGELARPYQDYRERASSSPRLLRSFTDSTHSIPYNYGVGHQS